MTKTRTKVAILGGGMGALSAAWELVQSAPDQYEITVYQRGSRLGGKGASGRNMSSGRAKRVEEHGLHILMGFYDNAFHVLKTCYAETEHEVGPWDEALIGHDHLQLPDLYEDGEYKFWELEFPSEPNRIPGQRSPDELPDISGLIQIAITKLIRLKRDSDDMEDPALSALSEDATAEEHDALGALEAVAENPREAPVKLGRRAMIAAIRLVVRIILSRVNSPEARDPESIKRRRQAMAAYFVGANLIGIVRHGLWKRQDFQAAAAELGAVDYKDWLRTQCKTPSSLTDRLTWNSPIVNALYDLIFSRCPGCPEGEPGFAAITAVYDALLMLTYYHGHLFYRMNGGMGDVVFAPLYLYLRSKHVTFEFFQTVKEIQVDKDTMRVSGIVLENAWDGPYEPVPLVNGRRCWRAPAAGDPPPGPPKAVEYTLKYDEHFHHVVLGISVAALKDQRLAGALCQANPAFAAMVHGIRTTPTQAVQLWFDCDTPALGWRGHAGMLGSFARPFNAWADMGRVLKHEDWASEGLEAKGLAYLCDVYSGPAEGASARVRQMGIDWLEEHGRRLWPAFDWSNLMSKAGVGAARFDDQYWTANLDPSDHYVLAAPGTPELRLGPEASGFGNLVLAGDWTKTELNAGCLEAATMSGRSAARAIIRSGVRLAPARREYVDADADWVLRHPVCLEEGRATALVLPADVRLDAFCRQHVEQLSDRRYTASPINILGLRPVLLVCANFPRVFSHDAEHGKLGSFAEMDVALIVPVTVRPIDGDEVTRGFIAPYLFVNHPIGVMAGREIFGLPKAFAKIRGGPQEPGPLDLGVTGDVLTEQGGQIKLGQAAILGVSPAANGASDGPTGEGFFDALERWLWPDDDPKQTRVLPLFIGKQLRDAVDPKTACHREFLRCDLELSDVGGFNPSVQSLNVFMPDYHKPRIAKLLGLDPSMKTRLSFQARFNLVFPRAQRLR